MNIVVLGGKSNLGKYLADVYAEDAANTVLALGRQDLDFSSLWVTKLKELLDSTFVSSDNVDLIVLTLFDNSAGSENVQLSVLKTLWPLYAKLNTTFVVLGSMMPYYKPIRSKFTIFKDALAKHCRAIALEDSVASLVLIEPLALENSEEDLTKLPHATYDKVCKLVRLGVSAQSKFIQLGFTN